LIYNKTNNRFIGGLVFFFLTMLFAHAQQSGFDLAVNLGFTIDEINSSFFYTNRVSGAKTSVADYSGYLRLTDELKGHTLGVKYYLPLRSYAKGGLDLDIYYGGKIKLKENNPDEGYLLNDNGEKVTTGWTGLTFGFGVTIPIGS